MPDYQNGKIYRIVCNITGEQYIGSTCVGLSQRLAKHKCHFNDWKNERGAFMSSFPILERGNYIIVLIEEYPCNNKEQLLYRERYWIEQYPDCVNKIRKPISSDEEQKERFNNWYNDNKERVIEQNRQYRNERKEHYQEYLRNYYQENKERLKEKNRQYQDDNKQKLSEKHNCECGGTFTTKHKPKHDRTQIHQEYLADLQQKNVVV